MPRPSVTRLLLRQLSFVHVRAISKHFEIPPKKSKEETIKKIIYKMGTTLETLVSRDSPFSLSQWNEITVGLGGSPRKSFEAIASELELILDPLFYELDGDTTISEIRATSKSLRILRKSLGIDDTQLNELLSKTNGLTHLSTFISKFRKPSLQQITTEPGSFGISLASTSVKATQIEELSTQWMKNQLYGAEEIGIAAGFYDNEFIKSVLLEHKTASRIRLLFNGLGGQRLIFQCEELKKLRNAFAEDHQSIEIRLAFAPGMFHSKLFLATNRGTTKALVGSANATTAAFQRNEEILVSIPDASAFAAYFNAAWGKAKELDQLDTSARSLVAFFRTGVLYFRPVTTLTTTINPFRDLLNIMTPDERALLGGLVLPHADQESGVGSFNLKLAVLRSDVAENSNGIAQSEDSSNAEHENITRLSIKPWCVETCFGYWVPSALDNKWQENLSNAGKEKRNKWEEFRTALYMTPREEISQRYSEYTSAVRVKLVVA